MEQRWRKRSPFDKLRTATARRVFRVAQAALYRCKENEELVTAIYNMLHASLIVESRAFHINILPRGFDFGDRFCEKSSVIFVIKVTVVISAPRRVDRAAMAGGGAKKLSRTYGAG